MKPERCDVLVVGGGPAGSSCAWKLVQSGLDVLVLDKQVFPRDKVCAGWVTPPVMDVLQLDLEDYRRTRVLQPISGFRTGLIDGSPVMTGYGRTVSYGIRRCEFDHYLLQHSQARVASGEPLESIERVDGHWRINRRIETPLLVGAGGHFCPVARHLGANLGSTERVVAAKEVEFEMTEQQRRACRAEAERPELYFCRDLMGYGWVFRKGDYLNIGLGREDNHKLAEQVDNFLAFLRREQRIPDDIPGRFKGHAYLLQGHGERKRIDDGVLLVGDAAGLASPQSGEGIRPAVESGLLAAAAIIAAGGDYRATAFAPYNRRLAARFGASGSSTPGVLGESLRNFLGGRLLGNAWFTRHVVLDRWFLHSRQSPLLVREAVRE
jgi:geranylgeranyl reductase family protein